MASSCRFRFHGNLADFLHQRQQGQWISRTVNLPTSAKDAIEAIGIPHVEVDKITVNEKDSPLSVLLQPGDSVEIFPVEVFLPGAVPSRFVLDVHLGKLARRLRMLGIDSVYQQHFSDNDIVSIAVNEQRVALTRDVGLLKHKVLEYGYWLRSQDTERQLEEVVKRFTLWPFLKPFSRCMVCNGAVRPVSKEAIIHFLLPKTKEYFKEFYQCGNCLKLYWKGSHYYRMQSMVERLMLLARQ